MEYVPQQPKQQPAPKSEYVLVEDVTGKPIPKRGPQVLKAYTEERVVNEETGKQERKQVILEFKVPYPPKEGCKKCYGRGYQGVVKAGQQHGVLICRKCYPMMNK